MTIVVAPTQAQLTFLKPYQSKAIAGKYFGRRRLVGRVLLFGGGVQSTTLAYMAAEGLIDIDYASFADTGDEPFWVYYTLGLARSALASRGIPLVTVMKECGYWRYLVASPSHAVRGSMPLWIKTPGKDKPGRLKRQCTTELKISPGDRYLRAWLVDKGIIQLPPNYQYEGGYMWDGASRLMADEWPRLCTPRDIYVETLFGITTDEMLRATERGPRWQKTRYPLIEMGMSRSDCVTWLKEHGYPVPRKSSCLECPYRTDEAWLEMATEFPEEFEEACRYDDWLRTPNAKAYGAYSSVRGEMYIHRLCIPLREVNFEALVARSKKSPTSEFEMELLEKCTADGGFSCMS